MTKFKIVSGNQTVEFLTETEAFEYKAVNNITEPVVSFEEEIYTAPVDFATIVKNAINFGSELLVSFAAENVSMGITQAGKTKAVADFLTDVTRYSQTGALYEILAEVERLEALGLPEELAPFVTTERFASFKSKIQNYLNG